MKKIFVLLITLFSLIFIANAEADWTLYDFNFSEDFGMTAIKFYKGSNSYFSAIGNEYECTYVDSAAQEWCDYAECTDSSHTDCTYENINGGVIWQGDCSNPDEVKSGTCNMYKIDLFGNVTKANKYYDNSNNDFPGYKYRTAILDESDNSLDLPWITITSKPAKEVYDVNQYNISSVWGDNRKTFNYCKCLRSLNPRSTSGTWDICEVGILEDNVQKYGIYDISDATYIVEPDSSYELVYNHDLYNYAILKHIIPPETEEEEETFEYVIVTRSNADHAKDVFTKEYLEENNIDINSLTIVNSETSTNYYRSAKPGIVPYGMAVYNISFFTNSGVSDYSNQIPNNNFIDNHFVKIIGGDPYIAREYEIGNASYYDLYSWNSSLIYNDIISGIFSNNFVAYTKDNTFIVSQDYREEAEPQMTPIERENKLEMEYEESHGLMKSVLVDDTSKMYLFKDNYVGEEERPEDWTPKYYLLYLGDSQLSYDSGVPGDWDNDGDFDITDIVYYRKYMAEAEEPVPKRDNKKYAYFTYNARRLLNFDNNTDMTLVDVINARIALANYDEQTEP